MTILDGKVAIVTGASMGIGKAIALEFANEGAKIVIADIDVREGRKVENLINKNEESFFIKTDVSEEKDVRNLVKKTIQKFGKIDIIVNNAGIYKPQIIEKLDVKTWNKTIDTNLKSVFLGIKYSIPFLKKNGGSIINMASSLGIVPEAESGVYCASKAAMIMLTKVAALENAKYGVRVNCICPGPIDTPLLRKVFSKDEMEVYAKKQTLMKRIGTPEDVAKVALFLVSDDSSYFTGATYTVDGGESIH
jgi:NAD(P)-dependent dehydrogenase (short-subunit alcohol dehydrogenase family)